MDPGLPKRYKWCMHMPEQFLQYLYGILLCPDMIDCEITSNRCNHILIRNHLPDGDTLESQNGRCPCDVAVHIIFVLEPGGSDSLGGLQGSLCCVVWTRESVFECGHCTKTYATSQPVLVGCRFVFIFVQAYPVNDS